MKSIKDLRIELDEKITAKNDCFERLKTIREDLKNKGEKLNDEEFNNKVALKDEVSKSFEDLNMEIVALKSEIKLKEEKRMGAIGDDITPTVTEAKGIEDSPELLEAYTKMINTGDDKDYKTMVKTLGTNPTDGTTANAFGILIPTVVQDTIVKSIEDYGGLYAITDKSMIPALLKIPIEIESTGVQDHDEFGPDIDEEEITLGEAILDPDYLKKYITWTHKLAALSGVDLMQELIKEFMRKFMIGFEERGFNAPADGKRLDGIIPYAKGTAEQQKYAVPVNGVGALTFRTILSMMSKVRVEPGQSARWFMHRETYYNAVLGIVDLTNKPIWGSMESKDGRITNLLYGYPVVFTDSLPPYDTAAATQAPIVFVAENAYSANFPEGLTPKLIYDPYTQAVSNKDRLVGRLLVAGRLTQLQGASVLIKGTPGAVADTTPPVITITTPTVTSWTTADDGTVTYGDLLTEAGITADDNVDGDLTANIVFDGTKTAADTIDLSTVGSSSVTLDVADAAGNNATQQTVTIVLATLAPPILPEGSEPTREELFKMYEQKTGKKPQHNISNAKLLEVLSDNK